MRTHPAHRITVLAALTFAACQDLPPTGPRVEPPPEGARPPALMQLTLTGIGTPAVSAMLAPLDVTGAARTALGTVPGGSSPGTIQVRRLSTSTLDTGVRGAGGVRYVQAVFAVRNADPEGNPFPEPRHNLAFVPVAAGRTFYGTPVLAFNRQDGTAADPVVAQRMTPTGAVALDGSGEVVSQYPDVLQLFTEDEVATLHTPADIVYPFPYGFVVRALSSTATRTLPADPAPEQFDGRVTFSYRLPLKDAPEDDAFTISILVLAVEEPDTRISQSPEEQTPAGQAAFEARAASLGAQTVRLLPRGAYSGPAVVERMCAVRVGGTRAQPAVWLGRPAAPWTLLLPDPHEPEGGYIPGTGSIQAAFDGCVWGVDGTNFTVHGAQSGRTVTGYTGQGTPLVTALGARFLPGEEVEVSLTSDLSPTPHVARYRVASGPASGTFGGEVNYTLRFAFGESLLGDLNGDGLLDVILNAGTRAVVMLGTGGSTLAPPVSRFATDSNWRGVLGDVTGDGVLDLVLNGLRLISVLPGLGNGAFGPPVSQEVEAYYSSVALGDLDGDGRLDLVVAERREWETATGRIAVLLNTGGGTFAPPVFYAAGGVVPFASVEVALGDLDGDGWLDVATSNWGNAAVGILRNTGGGVLSAPQLHTLFPGALPTDVAVGDLNGDGRPDVAASTGNGVVSVLINSAAGLQPPVNHGAGSYASSLALGDLNGDQRLDVAVTVGLWVQVLLGTGSGGFVLGQRFESALETSENIAVGDVTGDGRLDLLWMNHWSTSDLELPFILTVVPGMP
jgi:hypothetical protein